MIHGVKCFSLTGGSAVPFVVQSKEPCPCADEMHLFSANLGKASEMHEYSGQKYGWKENKSLAIDNRLGLNC